MRLQTSLLMRWQSSGKCLRNLKVTPKALSMDTPNITNFSLLMVSLSRTLYLERVPMIDLPWSLLLRTQTTLLSKSLRCHTNSRQFLPNPISPPTLLSQTPFPNRNLSTALVLLLWLPHTWKANNKMTEWTHQVSSQRPQLPLKLKFSLWVTNLPLGSTPRVPKWCPRPNNLLWQAHLTSSILKLLLNRWGSLLKPSNSHLPNLLWLVLVSPSSNRGPPWWAMALLLLHLSAMDPLLPPSQAQSRCKTS